MRDALRFSLFEDKGSCWLEIPGEHPVKTCSAEQARGARDDFSHALREARDQLGAIGGACDDMEPAHRFLSLINSEGIATLQTLLGDEIETLKSYLAPAIKRVESGGYGNRDLPIIQVEMPRNFIQIEALPFIEIGQMPRFTSLEEMLQGAMRFFGFAFVTQRIERAEADMDGTLRAVPKVPVKMFRHAELAGSAAEADMLAKDFALVGDGAWPTTGACTAEDTLSAMVHFDQDFAGRKKAAIDQIHHFSCHSDIGERHPYLEMMAAGGTPFQISTRSFNEQFRIAMRGQSVGLPRPLAFLNACESNSPSSESLGTWASTLVQARYRAVIATEAPAPDAFASAFSQAFYGELLAGHTVGQALQRAKRGLLERWKNPFGLLYTLFGNPDLRIG
jgi:hypothetical protein